MRKLGIVFWSSFALIMLAVMIGILVPKTFERVTGNIQNLLTTNFGWYYLLVVAIIIAFCIFLILSPVGAIRLGRPDDKPKYSNTSWFAMLFSAGMGIGLVFWGAAEPLSHFAISSPDAPEGSQQALKDNPLIHKKTRCYFKHLVEAVHDTFISRINIVHQLFMLILKF